MNKVLIARFRRYFITFYMLFASYTADFIPTDYIAFHLPYIG